MVAIIGTIEWQTAKGSRLRPKRHLRGYLRYAMEPDDGLWKFVHRSGEVTFEIDSRIISRCEVVSAWRMLPATYKDAIWHRVVKRRPPYEVAIAMGVSTRTLRRWVDKGLDTMIDAIYEPLISDD